MLAIRSRAGVVCQYLSTMSPMENLHVSITYTTLWESLCESLCVILSHRKLWESLWASMIHGLWVSVSLNESLCERLCGSVNLYGSLCQSLWVFVNLYESLSVSVGLHKYRRVSMSQSLWVYRSIVRNPGLSICELLLNYLACKALRMSIQSLNFRRLLSTCVALIKSKQCWSRFEVGKIHF